MPVEYAFLLALVTSLVTHFLTKSRERQKYLHSERNTFREALLPCIHDLKHSQATPACIVQEYYPEHEKSARKLLLYMSSRKKKKFVKLWNDYEALYLEKKHTLGEFSALVSEVDELPQGDLSRAESMRYLEEQNLKRRKEILTHLQLLSGAA